LTQVARASR